ncbi:hypothetical protein SAMN02799631_04558 [Methylobacterium sp. 174MFSha1.1]|uniref:hypothetical protein n=1 Tax=Methylobacterium sp. 174MFSha1.1 TaxID=1502749 RepID=UPI0008F0E2AE|nr:hypothetical protein [Methylobacterium sp. 174MFSha1.1]SFV07429.1 hypothetical protein SAMN02799631_04558 [Methylobacterium sp. 174MFSha1.1]
MATARRQDNAHDTPRVHISNTAANMVSSLHPFDKTGADATLMAIKASVLDPAKVKKIAGLDDAFVARAGDLRVLFKTEGDSLVITSVIAQT